MKRFVKTKAKAVFIVLAGFLMFAGCVQTTDNSDTKTQIKNNIIYTRSLKYIPHPEYYNYICLYSLKVTDGIGTLDEASFAKKHSKTDIANFKKKNSDVKLLLCVGGGTSEQKTNIYDSLKNDSAGFIKKLVKFADDYGLDGIDIDWEYFSGTLSKSYNPVYRTFMKDLRAALGKNRPLTMAVVDYDAFMDSDTAYIFNNYADVVSIMCYVPDDFEEAKSWIKKYAKLIEDKSKIAIGLPYYGRKAAIADASATSFEIDDGKGGKIKVEPKSIDYVDLLKELGEDIVENKCNYKQDKTVAYYYKNGTLYMFANKTTLKNREQWIIDNGYSGFMVWAADGDPEGVLQKITYEMTQKNK